MLRVDIISMTDDRQSQKLVAAIGLVGGRVQLLEGNDRAARDAMQKFYLDRKPITADDDPELFLRNLAKAYRSTYSWATAAYEDDDSNYDENGKFVGSVNGSALVAVEPAKPAALTRPRARTRTELVSAGDGRNVIYVEPENMPPTVIHLNVMMPEQKQPIINIINPITVQAAEQQPPAITVTIPEQPAPVINVTIPEQPAPVVNVEAAQAPVVNVAAPNIEVNVPPPQEFDVEAERDAQGRVKRFKRVPKKGDE